MAELKHSHLIVTDTKELPPETRERLARMRKEGNSTIEATRLLWLEHVTESRGRLVLDDGAVRALVDRRTSLLPAGITGVEGSFSAGEPVDLVAADGETVARGLVNYSSDELPLLLGRSTRALAAELGPEYEREVVHADDLVLFQRPTLSP